MKLIELANKFAQKIEQNGTTELFFGSPAQQEQFAKTIQLANGPIAQFLFNYSSKTGQPASFSLKVNADPGKGAAWILDVSPTSLATPVRRMIDQEFRKMMNQSMLDRLNSAIIAAKAGSGSGSLNVGSLDVG
jgi:hypothetical protein